MSQSLFTNASRFEYFPMEILQNKRNFLAEVKIIVEESQKPKQERDFTRSSLWKSFPTMIPTLQENLLKPLESDNNKNPFMETCYEVPHIGGKLIISKTNIVDEYRGRSIIYDMILDEINCPWTALSNDNATLNLLLFIVSQYEQIFPEGGLLTLIDATEKQVQSWISK
jgi:hypothetical protein